MPSTSPGQLRRAASSIVTHFVQHGAPDEDGLLTLGWHGPWRPLAQSYSGTGSPYWAAKGMLGLALPADHPVWTAAEEPLPVEVADDLVAVAAPGWIVSGTHDDGIVRVVNHGTDHALEGSLDGDSPLYARLGYSTATAPLLDDEAWAEPFDQAVVLVDADGRSTHRSGMTLLTLRGRRRRRRRRPPAARAPRRRRPDGADHGSGLVGTSVVVGTLTTVSVVRGAWEVRAVRVDDADPGLTLRSAGWPVSGEPVVPGARRPQRRADLAARRRRARHRGPAGQGRQPARHLDRDPLGVHPGGRRQLVGHRRLPRAAPERPPDRCRHRPSS